MPNQKELNRLIVQQYGFGENNLPKFRLAWTEDLTEKRDGQHDLYYNVLFVRTEFGVRECKKYSYLKDRWVLEYLCFDQALQPEIKKSDNYEPMFVFQTKLGDPLEPIWPVIRKLCDAWQIATGKKSNRTEKMDFLEDQLKLDAETKIAFDQLFGNDTDMLDGRFQSGEAVTIHKENS